MTTKTTQKARGLTPGFATGLPLTAGTHLTPDGTTPLTPPDATRRPYKKRARKCRCGCGKMVTPTAQAPHKVFFDDNCRKRYHHRQKAAQTAKKGAPELVRVPAICAYCGETFWTVEGKHGKYCKPSHKVAAAECRRDGAIRAYVEAYGWELQDARDHVESIGMKGVSAGLRLLGFVYDESSRRWGWTG